jgi:cation:H+ antiporter
LLLFGLLLLVGGGELLVRGAVDLASRLGVSPLVVSIVIVGFGTSAPELAASIEASRIGAPGIAWGNVVGSNMANSLLILGATAMLAPLAVERGPLWRDGGVALLATFLLYIFAADAVIGLLPGMAMLVMLFSYLGYAVYQERQSGGGAGVGGSAASDVALAHDGAIDENEAAHLLSEKVKQLVAKNPFIFASLLLLSGLGLILAGGNVVVTQAVAIASAFGLGDALIGVTIVAMGTSAPELVTSLIAARKGQGEIAIGNVLGSNIYNILGIGGVVALLAPGGFPAPLVYPDLPILLGSALLLIVFAATHYRIGRTEGTLLFLCYISYIAWKALTIIGQ